MKSIYSIINKAKDLEFVDFKEVKDFNEISDQAYLNFMNCCGDGYYFDRSMHFYSLGSALKFHDISEINQHISDAYKKNLKCFCEDAFGNQFAFQNGEICMLTIETGEIEILNDKFDDWLVMVLDDLNYYSGLSLFSEWQEKNCKLKYNERLTPKQPFVLGGKFEISNLYNLDSSKVISFNSDLATQIANLPDGSHINIKIIK